MIGIAVLTYNRRDAALGCVQTVRKYTQASSRLVVCDDGSPDGTRAALEFVGARVIGGERLGPARQANRALTYFMRHTQCDPLILLEDDCWPALPGWEEEWAQAAARWGQVCVPLGQPGYAVVDGSDTPEEPWWCRMWGAQCIAVTREAIGRAGYMDPRFYGLTYSVAHLEWTRRLAGVLGWGRMDPAQPLDLTGGVLAPCLDVGIARLDFGTWYHGEDLARSREVAAALEGEAPYRLAWRGSEERAAVLAEVGG